MVNRIENGPNAVKHDFVKWGRVCHGLFCSNNDQRHYQLQEQAKQEPTINTPDQFL